MATVVQIPSIILPQLSPLGTEFETVQTLVTHPSLDVTVDYLQEKVINITAIEIVLAAGNPGPLWCWVEISPVSFATTDVYYTAVGGGGGGPINAATLLPYVPPVAPAIIAPLSVNGTVHSLVLPWTAHSVFARLIVQTPVAATPATEFWWVQAVISAKTP